MILERGAHSNWAKKLVSSPRLREGLLPFLGMGADCRERRARSEKFFSKGAGKIGKRKHSGGVMGNVLIGTTMSLDGFMNDRADVPREERK